MTRPAGSSIPSRRPRCPGTATGGSPQAVQRRPATIANAPSVVENLADGGRLLVDGDAEKSHALSPEAAAVWSCLEEGSFDRDRIVAQTSLDGETVDRALAEFAECGLLDTGSASSRRELLSRAAAIAGAAAGLKLVESVATPTPAAAQSLVDDSIDSE